MKNKLRTYRKARRIRRIRKDKYELFAQAYMLPVMAWIYLK